MTSRGESVPETPLTSLLAEGIQNIEFDDIPVDATTRIERCFVDTIGVTLAGGHQGPGARASQLTTGSNAGTGPASVLGKGSTTTIMNAAFVNGVSAHGLDFDDVAEATLGHPSVTMISTILALGETIGASGQDLIAAYAAGFETQALLASLVESSHQRAGWHPTATIGAIGAAGAATKILELDVNQTRHALNNVVSTLSGLSINFGTMTKPMHAGHAARSGTTAALLASEGFTAAPEAITGNGGFLDVYSANSDETPQLSRTIGDEWSIVTDGVHIKKFPCCHYTHAAIAATSEIVSENDILSKDIEQIHVTASEGAAQALQYGEPEKGLEGKFSMQHTVACAALYGDVDLESFREKTLQDPGIQRLRERVEFLVDQDLPYESKCTMVQIELDSDRFEREIEFPPGHHKKPLSDAEIREKFLDCATMAIDDSVAERVLSQLDQLRNLNSVADLMAQIG